MKQKVELLLSKALETLRENGTISNNSDISVQITATKDKKHGDYACNLALMLAKPMQLPPQEIAEKIIAAIPENDDIRKTEIAGPGFINFFMQESGFHGVIHDVLAEANNYGRCTIGQGKSVHIEYVSANPTGPLHVGHGRGAAYGACVANLLQAAGYRVHREYYVNDAGRQMRILALSTWLRYLQLENESIDFPENAYQGDYIIDIAKALKEDHKSRFHHTQESIDRLLAKKDVDAKEDKEAYIDALVNIAIEILGEENFAIIFTASLNSILADIREDLSEFGVNYDEWFRESKLHNTHLLGASIDLLDKQGYVYEKDGARWFEATKFGDEKDRVLIRKNGQPTYFASDVAYHLYKYKSGYDNIIDVFGADHHGYTARLHAFLQALNEDPNKVLTLLVQFAILYRGKTKVSMSTRSGEFVTLRELREEVGNDAARFFYIMRKPEQHLDFDLELATSKSNENPVYYIQYAFARICSVWRQLKTTGETWDKTIGFDNLNLLTTSHEKDLMASLIRYPDIIKRAAKLHEPHLLAHFLQELANQFHSYYNAEKFLLPQTPLRNARLCLIAAVQQVFTNGLRLLGVSAPEEM